MKNNKTPNIRKNFETYLDNVIDGWTSFGIEAFKRLSNDDLEKIAFECFDYDIICGRSKLL